MTHRPSKQLRVLLGEVIDGENGLRQARELAQEAHRQLGYWIHELGEEQEQDDERQAREIRRERLRLQEEEARLRRRRLRPDD